MRMMLQREARARASALRIFGVKCNERIWNAWVKFLLYYLLVVFFSCPSALDFLELGLRFLSKDAFHIRSQDETARLLEVIVIQ